MGTDRIRIRFLRLKEVTARTGLSRSTIYNKLDCKSQYFDPAFPEQIRLGGGAVAWVEGELENWMNEKIQKSRIQTHKLKEVT